MRILFKVDHKQLHGIRTIRTTNGLTVLLNPTINRNAATIVDNIRKDIEIALSSELDNLIDCGYCGVTFRPTKISISKKNKQYFCCSEHRIASFKEKKLS